MDQRHSCKCNNVNYSAESNFCYDCGGSVTSRQLSDSNKLTQFCQVCTIRVRTYCTYCTRCGISVKQSQIKTFSDKQDDAKMCEVDSYFLIAEALMRTDGANLSELKALQNLLLKRFPKGNCQLAHISNTTNVIGFSIFGQDTVTRTSAVLELARRYAE